MTGTRFWGLGLRSSTGARCSRWGPYMWIRNTEANHGNVFVDCTFVTRERPVSQTSAAPVAQPGAPARAPMSAVLARLPNNHGLNYPYAEAVLINCKLKGIPAVGWGPIEDDTEHLHLWEYNSTDMDGKPIDVSEAPCRFTAAYEAAGRADYFGLQ